MTHTLTADGADASEDGTGRGTPIIAEDTQVRRLTPLECERLQGFPDAWTEGQSDSPRYRQMGNAVAVPVFEWVARRVIAEEPALARRCVTAGCKPAGIVLDPYHGAGTTGMVATQLGHRYVGIELSADNLALSLRTRLAQGDLPVGDAS